MLHACVANDDTDTDTNTYRHGHGQGQWRHGFLFREISSQLTSEQFSQVFHAGECSHAVHLNYSWFRPLSIAYTDIPRVQQCNNKWWIGLIPPLIPPIPLTKPCSCGNISNCHKDNCGIYEWSIAYEARPFYALLFFFTKFIHRSWNVITCCINPWAIMHVPLEIRCHIPSGP